RRQDRRLVLGVLGAPERGELAVEVGALVGKLGRAEPVDRVGSRLLANGQQLVADFVDGLIPRHAGPLAVDELHRITQPAIATHELAHRGALGAVRAAVERAFPARLLPDPYAVGDFRDYGAAHRAVGADALAHLDLRALRRRRPRLRLAHAADLQRAEGGKAAQSRAPQE